MTDHEQALEMARQVVLDVIEDAHTTAQDRIADALLEARARECERVPRPSSILRAAELRAQIKQENT